MFRCFTSRQFCDLSEGYTVIARIQRARGNAHVGNHLLDSIRIPGNVGDGPYCLRGIKFVLDPRHLAICRYRNLRRFLEIAVCKQRKVWRAAACRQLWMKRFHRHISRGSAICHNDGVSVKLGRLLRAVRSQRVSRADALKGPGRVRRMCKNPTERLAAFDKGFAPDILLHSLGSRYPRSARLAPSRRAGNRHLKTVLIAQPNRVPECILPFWRHVGQPMIHYLRSL